MKDWFPYKYFLKNTLKGPIRLYTSEKVNFTISHCYHCIQILSVCVCVCVRSGMVGGWD